MLYLFNLVSDSSYKMVLNGNLLYGVEGECKTNEFYLNDKERFVLEYLIKYSTSHTPSTARDIEKAYKVEFLNEFGLYSLKNTIASIRKKYKIIMDGYSIDASNEFIINVFKKGYYLNIDVVDSASINQYEKFDINDHKVCTASMVFLFFKIYYLTIFKKSLMVIVLSILTLGLMYVLQIFHINSILNKYKSNTDLTASKMMLYGCEDNKIQDVLNQSLNLDSAILVDSERSCLIYRDKVKEVSGKVELNSLLKVPHFVYTRRENQEGVQFYARISKQSIESRYKNTLLPFLIDSVIINNELGELLSTNEASTTKIYAKEFRDGAWVTYYSDDFLYELLLLFLGLSFLLYGRSLFRSFYFVTTWYGLKYKLEVVMDTSKNRPIYYEVLTRVRKGSPIDYIDNIRRSKLVTFHTILTLRAIEEAQYSKANNNYGINLCPTSLQGEEFFSLKKYLGSLKANEIILEVTENSSVQYTQEIIDNVLHLKSKGFVIALDDFGTGNNNIEMVKNISPDYLKIDRQFINDIQLDSSGAELLVSFSNIGAVSNSTIIQEGVESIGQKDLLVNLGFTYQQGYLYSDES